MYAGIWWKALDAKRSISVIPHLWLGNIFGVNNHLASLAKWLSVRLRTNWLWVLVQLQSLTGVFENFWISNLVSHTDSPKEILLYLWSFRIWKKSKPPLGWLSFFYCESLPSFLDRKKLSHCLAEYVLIRAETSLKVSAKLTWLTSTLILLCIIWTLVETISKLLMLSDINVPTLLRGICLQNCFGS